MTTRTLIFLSAVLLTKAFSPARSEEAVAAPMLEEYQVALKSIDSEIANSIAIFRVEVNAGKEEDGWSPNVKEEALQWVDNNPTTQLPMPAPKDMADRRAAAALAGERMKIFRNHPKLSPPAFAPAAWLIGRISVLQERRSDTLLRYAEELTTFAEDNWIKAEKPADLRPVAAAFAKFDTLAPNSFAQTNLAGIMARPPMPEMPPGMAHSLAALQDARRVESFYARLFAAEDNPLIFPNPETDLGGYTKTRVIWAVLLMSKTPFLTRPRIEARMAQLDAHYDALRVSAGERLNALIEKNAPAATFEEALSHFNAYPDRFDPLSWGLPPQMRMGTPAMAMGMPQLPMSFTDSEGRTFIQMMPAPLRIQDYHDLLGSRAGGPPQIAMGGLPWEIQERRIQHMLAMNANAGIHRTYRQWLDFRRAEESGDLGAMAVRWSELQMVLLPPATQEAILKRHKPPGAREIATAPSPDPDSWKTQPVTKLIASLDDLRTQIQNEEKAGQPMSENLQYMLTDLLNAWKEFDEKDSKPSRDVISNGMAGLAWRALAERPDCVALFALREKAARYALAQILLPERGDAQGTLPLWKALEIALETSVMNDDWPQFRRILRLDCAANSIPDAGHLAWSQVGDAFEQAADASKSSPETARARYLEISRTSDKAAVTATAVRRLKALSIQYTLP